MKNIVLKDKINVKKWNFIDVIIQILIYGINKLN